LFTYCQSLHDIIHHKIGRYYCLIPWKIGHQVHWMPSPICQKWSVVSETTKKLKGSKELSNYTLIYKGYRPPFSAEVPKRLHGLVLNQLSKGTTLLFTFIV
jgi:hypothetical protein